MTAHMAFDAPPANDRPWTDEDLIAGGILAVQAVRVQLDQAQRVAVHLEQQLAQVDTRITEAEEWIADPWQAGPVSSWRVLSDLIRDLREVLQP